MWMCHFPVLCFVYAVWFERNVNASSDVFLVSECAWILALWSVSTINTRQRFEQVTVRIFVSSMESFKCYMQNKTFYSCYHGNSFTRKGWERGREMKTDTQTSHPDFFIYVCSWTIRVWVRACVRGSGQEALGSCSQRRTEKCIVGN